jgi:hypothetical protein
VTRRLLLLPLALVLVLLAACNDAPDTPDATSTPEATATPMATATPEPTPTPRPRPEANRFPPDLQAEADRLLQLIVDQRGTPLTQPVDMFLLTREQARKFYSTPEPEESPTPAPAEPTATPGPPPEPTLDAKQEVYELLGLVPKRQTIEAPTVQEQQVDNLISIITGFYDSGFKAFYMIDSINGGVFGPLARSTIVHELVHALQYQQADIQAIGNRRAGNADAFTALLSVLEGDAVNTENLVLGYSTRSTYRQPVCFTIPAPARQGTPFVIERELDVWYEDGLCFVRAIAETSPDGIAGIWNRVPSTTEQILHPEKYLAGEVALPLTQKDLDSALGGGWDEVGDNVFGEFGLQNVLLTGLVGDRPGVQTAAAGWGGDRWRLYANGDSRLFHLDTVWDSDVDATEFVTALDRMLTNRGAMARSQLSDSAYTAEVAGVSWAVSHRGDAVTLVVTNDPAALPPVAAELGL